MLYSKFSSSIRIKDTEWNSSTEKVNWAHHGLHIFHNKIVWCFSCFLAEKQDKVWTLACNLAKSPVKSCTCNISYGRFSLELLLKKAGWLLLRLVAPLFNTLCRSVMLLWVSVACWQCYCSRGCAFSKTSSLLLLLRSRPWWSVFKHTCSAFT